MVGIVITQQKSVSLLSPQGKLTAYIEVMFTVDGDGPFVKTFPSEGFTGFAARTELETFAREVRTLRGQS
jgi:hypothetical protein